MLMMERDQPLCLHCAGLGDLEFLPSGDTALTRWTTKYSARTAVVVRFSRSRGRYERQGILAEPRAIERAEQECEDDAEERKAQRAKAALARVEEDKAFAKVVADEIRRLWPGVPPAEAREIAAHTAVPSSGRVGRSAAGRSLDPGACEPRWWRRFAIATRITMSCWRVEWSARTPANVSPMRSSKCSKDGA